MATDDDDAQGDEGDLLEEAADAAADEPQPDFETIAEVRDRAHALKKSKDVEHDQVDELRQLVDDAVPDDRPELRRELLELLDSIATKPRH